MHSRVS
ncbi:hypothetical protein E2320_002935, partial [Naja naja]